MRFRLLATALLAATTASAQTTQAPPHPCQTLPEARQFDFWIGSWEVTPSQVSAPTAAQRMGTNVVTRMLEHCVLLENWKAARGGAIAADTVRQLFEQSDEGGKTWKSTFDGRYVRTP